VIWAGYGNDTITGGDNGRNRLHGGPGDDTVTGGAGRDFLWGGRGVDVENGGDGNDVLHALAPDGQVDALDCGPGARDVAWLRAGENDTTVNCEILKTVSVGSDG
jgi:Ca2+-binding RTX toxin-like protein